MTIEEMQKGYQNEVAYQKHMLRNLGYWFQLFLTVSAIGFNLLFPSINYVALYNRNYSDGRRCLRNVCFWLCFLARTAECHSGNRRL